MKQNVSESMFRDSFRCRPENFTYQGLTALYDWLIDLEEDTGEELELDPIGLCCEFTEYGSIQEFWSDYNADYETIEDVRDATCVIDIDGTAFIIQAF